MGMFFRTFNHNIRHPISYIQSAAEKIDVKSEYLYSDEVK